MEKTSYRSANVSHHNNRSLVKSNFNIVDKDKDTVSTNKQEEWTTSKKVINHKTKQVETRVQRQIVMEDGKVIADSGPQVTTRTKEDQKTEESENCNKKSNCNEDKPPGEGYMALPGAQVISEKIETHNTTKEAKQENLQYHDESIKELTGYDIHRKAIAAPNELIAIDDGIDNKPIKGKLTHYSSKFQKVSDREEVKEISRRNRDGKITTETTRTHHHEELDDDEIPEEEAGNNVLPEASKETKRNFQYLKDYEDDDNDFKSTQQRLAVEGRHSEHTNNWIENHFGSEDERPSKSRIRTEGNKINIELSSRQRSRDQYSSLDRNQERRTKEERKKTYETDYRRDNENKIYRSTASCRIGSPSPVRQTPSPRKQSPHFSQNESRNCRKSYSHERYIQRGQSSRDTSRSRVFKEDASVQASLSDEDSSENEIENERREDSKKINVRCEERDTYQRSNERPLKTYYFGEENNRKRDTRLTRRTGDEREMNQEITPEKIYSTHLTIEKDHCCDNRYKNNLMSTRLEDDFPPFNTNEGSITATFKHERKSAVNDQIIQDTSQNESFHRSYHGPEDKREAQKSFDKMMDKSFLNHFKTSDLPKSLSWRNGTNNERELIHSVKIDENSHGYKDPSRRQRSDYIRNTTPAAPLQMPELIKVEDKGSSNGYYSNYRYSSRDASPNTGTWTKSKGRVLTPIITSQQKDDSKWPEFSPLLSPLEIRNMSFSPKNEYKSDGYSYYERS